MITVILRESDAVDGVLARDLAVVHRHGVADALETDGVLEAETPALHVAGDVEARDDVTAGRPMSSVIS